MSGIKVRVVDKRSIKVVAPSDKESILSNSDIEMDARAKQAVRTALAKAEFCKKPVAKYDTATKRAYVEYANGEKRYVN